MKVKVFFLDSSLGMVDYDFIGEFDICFDPDTLKNVRNAEKKGFYWKFVTDEGIDLTFDGCCV